jgi:hypothetical protein
VRCCVNERQVAIALVGGEIIYFELDRLGLLKEFSYVMSSILLDRLLLHDTYIGPSTPPPLQV